MTSSPKGANQLVLVAADYSQLSRLFHPNKPRYAALSLHPATRSLAQKLGICITFQMEE